MRLRDHREKHATRGGARWRLPIGGAIFAVLVGAACWAPLAPTVLAPDMPSESTARWSATAAVVAAPQIAAALPAGPPEVGVVLTPAPTSGGLAATPVLVPQPTPTAFVVPTLTATGQALLDSIKSDRSAQWVKNHTETPLRSGPNEGAAIFTRLPQWSLLKQIDSKPDWLMVWYSGDGETRQAGPGWVKASDVGGVDAPTVWLRTSGSGSLWSVPDASGRRLLDVPRSTLMEVLSSGAYISGTRVHVRLPGDGRQVPPSEGWVDGGVVSRTSSPSVYQLPWAYPDDLQADVRINVPYRTQLDGSDYAGANCGPTVLGMTLESFGVNLAPPDVRSQVLNSENFDPADSDAGSFIWALADVAQSYGLRAGGLYQDDGSLHHWTPDEIRATVKQGHPVIVQVVYRALPGREDSGYYGDHYIVITGLLGDKFLYNDPIGGAVAHEAPGYDRLMTTAQLQRAMHASDTPYAFSAFGLSR